ncbi:hypothetical protein Hamer_G007188 [Homarus americanus]|uniref:Uncharacterized protein n=1 Tax=Homarus americanus TaxID=6706 RepID=A0A8J5K259_HOMAM|nr:hypothetical protein Hamer_G007188 [Homarus americanus]
MATTMHPCRLIPVELDAEKPYRENDVVSLPACPTVNLCMPDAEMSPAGILSPFFQPSRQPDDTIWWIAGTTVIRLEANI